MKTNLSKIEEIKYSLALPKMVSKMSPFALQSFAFVTFQTGHEVNGWN